MSFSSAVAVLTSPNSRLPDPRDSPTDGPVAVGGDLGPDRLIEAYEKGIFPWYSNDDDPVLWWSPDPRAILQVENFKPSKSLRKIIRNGHFQVTFDQAFSEVIAACAEPRSSSMETWITPNMQQAYIALHELELGHSVECWQEGELVGGLYGVSLGTMFFGESMFSKVS
ncbi:MAG TPA: leucyl/phenylalanyl-tRNA--protein transferase, partial [Gammaproteobacteria bacterium]|nr:leucyl/phenylalanyl-tRNA--protein transferase [Gammaproteobacteria bacterium]